MNNYAGLGAADFAVAIGGRLPPRGLAWPRRIGTVFQTVWSVIAAALAAVHARAGNLTEQESFPPQSVELLPDWERVLGLPDPCLGAGAVTSARQAAVKARLAATGGQEIAYFETLAVNLGGAIASTEYAPFRLGRDRFGMPMRVAAWANIWQVTLSQGGLFHFDIGASSFGEPFWWLANGPIQCEIRRLAPAHVRINFAVASGVAGSGWFVSDLSLTDSGAVVQ